MPNYVALGGKWYNLSHDPVKAAAMAANMKALSPEKWTVANFNTECQKTDTNWKVFADAYALGGNHGEWKW